MPMMPDESSPRPATIAETVVPWPTRSVSPSPLGSTRAMPGSTWPRRSGWVASTPESITATVTPAPLAYVHAPWMFSVRRYHSSPRTWSPTSGLTGSASGIGPGVTGPVVTGPVVTGPMVIGPAVTGPAIAGAAGTTSATNP